MPCSIGVVGADAEGKTSFVLALGAKPAVSMTNTSQRHVVPTFLWPRPSGNGHKKTVVHILHSREEVLDSDDDRVFVLLFDLTRRDSLATVVAHWAYLSDTPGRRLLLVGTHADCTSKRQVSLAEAREFSGEFSAYEEVCCRSGHSGDEGMLRVQLTLNQWTIDGPRVAANDIPLARASICGGFPRPVVTMMVPAGTSYSLPASPAGQQCFRMQADIRLDDPTAKAASSPVATNVGGDVKLRTISKAIYDIRGAVAEKSKALAKYRDRQVSHWLTRSRYFGPTESSRHKRWQEEQKKRQQSTQSQSHHHHHHHAGHWRRQSITPDTLQDQRGRSVSQPDTFGPPSRKPSARCGSANYSSSGENEESPGTFSAHKSFLQPTDRTKHQRQRQSEEATLPVQKKCVAAIRASRKQRRAASNDMYERSTSPAVFNSYLNCYDEMDMPPQLQPSSPSLDRHKPHSRPSSVSIMTSPTSWKSFASREHSAFETDCVTLAGAQHSLDLSAGDEPAGRLSTSLPVAHVQSPVASLMSPPAPSYQSPSVLRHHSATNVLPATLESAFLSDTALELTIVDKPLAESKSLLPSRAIAGTKPMLPAVAPPEKSSAVSRSNTMCSSGSENFDCNDIDDMIEYFEGMTLPI